MTTSERSSYTALDFLAFRDQGALDVTPKFQRRPIWSTPARAYFIDTLLQGLPVPPIYLRVRQSSDKTRTIREVIDGQQRISALLDYIDGKFALTSALDPRYARREFGQLASLDQDAIREYPFLCEVLHGVSDPSVLEIFARLNTYSIQLNAQELRNGSYFGFFKQSAYGLALEHIEFWRANRIVSERGIARMQEVELTSELMILELAGLQDKKKRINHFYSEYDEEFPQKKRVEAKFRATLDLIGESLGALLAETHFRRPPLFYSLFGAVCHRRFGIPGIRLATRKKPLSESDRRALRDAVLHLSEMLDNSKQDLPVSERYLRFINASLRQTDNLQPRQTRLGVLYRAAW